MARRMTTIKEISQRQGTAFHEACYDEGHSKILRKTFDSTEIWDLPAPYVCCGNVKDVVIFGGTYLYSSDDAYVFHCQSFQNELNQRFAGLVQTFIDGRRDRLYANIVEQECIFLGGTWSEPTETGLSHLTVGANFGHFIFEYLNRLVIFEMFGIGRDLPVVVYENLPKPWLGFLELAGIARERIITVPIAEPPAYRNAWVSSSCHYRDLKGRWRYWAAGQHWLRFRVLSSIGGPRLAERRRLFLGRGDARWRRIVNEAEVIALLRLYGFESVDMAALTAREQVEIVSGAEFMICALGAGTIMSSFAPEHCINILLAPRDVGLGLWGGLGSAMALRQVHERIDCDHVEAPGQFRDNGFGFNEVSDYRVDLDVLRRKVEDMVRLVASGQRRNPLLL